jgi:hypothetical protein
MSGNPDETMTSCTDSMAVQAPRYRPTSASPCDEPFPFMEFVP